MVTHSAKKRCTAGATLRNVADIEPKPGCLPFYIIHIPRDIRVSGHDLEPYQEHARARSSLCGGYGRFKQVVLMRGP
jgi:hypothetical protein